MNMTLEDLIRIGKLAEVDLKKSKRFVDGVSLKMSGNRRMIVHIDMLSFQAKPLLYITLRRILDPDEIENWKRNPDPGKRIYRNRMIEYRLCLEKTAIYGFMFALQSIEGSRHMFSSYQLNEN